MLIVFLWIIYYTKLRFYYKNLFLICFYYSSVKIDEINKNRLNINKIFIKLLYLTSHKGKTLQSIKILCKRININLVELIGFPKISITIFVWILQHFQLFFLHLKYFLPIYCPTIHPYSIKHFKECFGK